MIHGFPTPEGILHVCCEAPPPSKWVVPFMASQFAFLTMLSVFHIPYLKNLFARTPTVYEQPTALLGYRFVDGPPSVLEMKQDTILHGSLAAWCNYYCQASVCLCAMVKAPPCLGLVRPGDVDNHWLICPKDHDRTTRQG